MAAMNHGISWQQYCGLVAAALWAELPLPAQLVEYYWDVGHVGHAVGRFCRGKLARPDGVVQEVGVDAGWHFREAIPWTRQVLRFACWMSRAQRCCQLAELRFFWSPLSKPRRRRSGARGALLSPAWCLCWCGRRAMRRSSAASTSCWRRCARCCRWTSCRCTAASCRCLRRCPTASGSAWLVGFAIPAADVPSSSPTGPVALHVQHPIGLTVVPALAHAETRLLREQAAIMRRTRRRRLSRSHTCRRRSCGSSRRRCRRATSSGSRKWRWRHS